MASSDLRGLAKEIERASVIIESYGMKQDIQQARVFQIQPVPREVELARTTLIDLSEQLSKLANPDARLTNIRNNTSFNGCLHFILHYGIHKHVPVLGQMTFRELGHITGVDETLCTRILRTAMALDLFAEIEGGAVTHSYLTRRLAEDDSLAAILETRLEEAVPAYGSLVSALPSLNSEEHSDSPWNRRNQTELHFFKFLDNHPRRSTNFALSMQLVSKRPENSPAHLIHGYPWGDLGDAKVVDVGGSNGAHAKALSEAFPELMIVVQDLAGTIGEVSEGSGRMSGKGRLSFMVHDFFLTQPIRDAEVYFLRWILHDYTDKYAVKILHNIADVMKPSGRILVMDRIVPPPTTDLTPEVRETRYVLAYSHCAGHSQFLFVKACSSRGKCQMI